VAAHFVSEPLQAGEQLVDASAFGRGEPPLPEHFLWRDEKLVVRAVVRTWRSTNTDRGDTYLARHWYALALADGREAVVYFDRKARRGAAVWWLYTLADERDEKPG